MENRIGKVHYGSSKVVIVLIEGPSIWLKTIGQWLRTLQCGGYRNKIGLRAIPFEILRGAEWKIK